MVVMYEDPRTHKVMRPCMTGCGVKIETAAVVSRILCDDCREKRAKAAGKRWRAKQRNIGVPMQKGKQRPYRVVSCPPDESGLPAFPIGAAFSAVEVRLDVRAGHYPPGMVLRSKNRLYEVTRKLDKNEYYLKKVGP